MAKINDFSTAEFEAICFQMYEIDPVAVKFYFVSMEFDFKTLVTDLGKICTH